MFKTNPVHVVFHVERAYAFNPAISCGAVDRGSRRLFKLTGWGHKWEGERAKARKRPQPPVETGSGARGVHLNRLSRVSEWGGRG